MGVLIIAGPTSVGKSSLALKVAETYDAVILSADAMTVYKGLDIGTAKPSQEEQERVPHYGIDLCNIDEEFSVIDFIELYEKVVEKHKRVILVGGTHFYINTLIAPIPDIPLGQPEIRARLEKEDNLYQKLQIVDPVFAQNVHPNNKRKIIRALEVFEVSGIPLSVHHKKEPARKPIQAECIWLERDDIRERIALRIEQMVADGYWEECQRILQEGWSMEAKPLISFSYRYMLSCLQENGDKEEALEKTRLGTWKLVRKQRTWGKHLGWDHVHPDYGWEWVQKNNPFVGKKS